MKILLSSLFALTTAAALAQTGAPAASGAAHPGAPVQASPNAQRGVSGQPPVLNTAPPNPTTPPPMPTTPPPVPNTPPPNPVTPPPMPNTAPPVPNTPPPINGVPGANGQVVQPGVTPGVNPNPNINSGGPVRLNQSVQSSFGSQPLNQTSVPTNTINNNGYGLSNVRTNGVGGMPGAGWPNNREVLNTNGAPPRL